MAEHARLSPSAAERWLVCPASIRMEDYVPEETESPYATEGTAAHALAELKARHEILGTIDAVTYANRVRLWRLHYGIDSDTFEDMDRYTDEYVDLLNDRLTLYPMSNLMLEQRLDTGVPESWGTSDAVIASPQHIEIVDFKYGQGVEVEVEGNPQLRLYALGALDTYGDILGDTEVVRLTVHQPRLEHILTDEMTPAELRAWREEIIPLAELALSDDAPFGPSADACRWCPASGRCAAQFEHVIHQDFDTPFELMSPEDMADALDRVEEIKIWLGGLEESALHMAYSLGKPIPGRKVVMSGGQRKITDQDAAIDFLLQQGYEPEDVTNTKIKGIGDLERLLGIKRFTNLLAPYLTRTEGRPSLVSEDDRRPAIDPNTEAAKAFEEEPS